MAHEALKKIPLANYTSWKIRGGSGGMKSVTMTVRIDTELDERIKEFIDDPENRWWNKGELIRAALSLFLDAFDSQKKKKKVKKKGPEIIPRSIV